MFAVWGFAFANAQSTMTDEQVLQYVIKEHDAGTSQAQIVTKLMQKGVDISQIRRIRQKYERQLKNGGLGIVADESVSKAESTLRKNNGDAKKGTRLTKDKSQDKKRTNGYTSYKYSENTNGNLNEKEVDADDDEYKAIRKELQGFGFEDEQADESADRESLYHGRKVFGRNIFNREDLTFEPVMNIATPQNYVVGPGDEVKVDIYGASQKSEVYTVSPDGDITIEGFGPVTVAGLTVHQANARLRSTLGARYSSSSIKMTLGQTRTITVNVMGEVMAPGTYTLSAFASVFHALYMAGGVNEIGTLRSIKVFRKGKLLSNVDIYDYMLNGKMNGNVRLQDNDVIMVGPYECIVDIAGKVKRPMYYEMKKSESLTTLLRYAGSFASDAYTKSLRVIRKNGSRYSVHNVAEFDMSSFHVADGDSVTVDSIIPRFENMVEVKGAVFRPGMYQIGDEISTVRSLIEASEGLTEDAFTARAVMHRMNRDRTLKVISLDIEGIMSGKSPDVALQNEDVVFIPTISERQDDRTITIHGEVRFPGVYKYADNETLEDFVLQAGGLKNSASTVKVDVSRRIINPKALSTDSVTARTYSFALKDGFVIDGNPGFELMPFDEVSVRKSPGFSKQQNITVDGEVMFSGTYTLAKNNTRLSDVIKAAGGVNDRGYAAGATLVRKINESERKRLEAARKMALEQYEQVAAEEAAKTGQKMDMTNSERLKKFQIEDTYSVGIELDKAIANPGGDEDIVLREGDRIVVPQYTGTVKINGEVMYPNTVGFVKGKKASYYIDQAGGFGSKAKRRQTYIIYMNGTVAKVSHNAKPMPGCEIVVPAKATSKMSVAETMTIGTSVASIATMIATLANIL